MKPKSKIPSDEFEIRCPRLGHNIYFSYCRSENGGLPCFKALDCWHPHFEVENCLRKELSEEQWQQTFMCPPKPKVLSLVEMVAKYSKPKKGEPEK